MKRVLTNEAYKWTDKDDEYLRQNYNTMTRQRLSKDLGRTVQTLNWRAGLLGVRNTRPYGGYVIIHDGETKMLSNRDLVNLALAELPHNADVVVAQVVPLKRQI